MSASALRGVFSAFNNEKPNSSITQWVDILTGVSYEDEAYDGIPDLVDSINLQPTGPTEASRALRKKLKHGNAHNQYRALVILKALVENCGQKFQITRPILLATFADGQLTDALKHLASDPHTDPKVKKKLLFVFASWHTQFKDDPKMSIISGFWNHYRPAPPRPKPREVPATDIYSRGSLDVQPNIDQERRRKEKEEKEMAKQKARDAKDNARKAEEDARRRKNRPKRAPFDFEKEKPEIFTAIANASQAANNLVNAITLVNAETDSLKTNERVQECLGKAKLSRKPIVRYIQLVENEELIGTLIDTNERIIASLEMYDKLSSATQTDPAEVSKAVDAGLAAANMSHADGEVTKLQERQRAAVTRAVRGDSYRGKPRQNSEGTGYVHPDLQDLSFGGPLGADQGGLPAPLHPAVAGAENGDNESWDRRGSLSDFSDYEDDSDEGQTIGRAGRGYVTVSDDEAEEQAHHASGSGQNKLVDVDDPFADPFAG
ncbi:hypothetical protein HWV62_42466 [Athelia sp. TMB]|nr:hypothetical protein HWV62_42466 [Athelia sp. TMB]